VTHGFGSAAPGRVHLARRQRGADATALGQLLFHLPAFLVSFVLVCGVSYAVFPHDGWVVVVLWLASGALVFHRPTESAIARHLLHLRHPTPDESSRLEPEWRAVSALAGVEGRAYHLWIEESDTLNALSAAGHIVGVTRFSLTLPTEQLRAVLAHELSHHTGGHAWSSLLGSWYATPGRLAWSALRTAVRLCLRLNGCLALMVLLLAAAVAFALVASFWFVVVPLLAAPYLLAAVGRRAELRADRHAAALGFAPMLAQVLHTMQAQEKDALRAPSLALPAHGATAATTRSGLLTRLLSSHPDYHTRLHELRPYLEPTR
jgi:Zn-dependent protease with chaperone function